MDAAERSPYGRIFVVLAAGCGLFGLFQSLVLPVLPLIAGHVHTSQNSVTWVVTAYLLSASVFTPLMGRLGDSAGKQRLLFVSLMCLAVGSLLGAIATSLPIMILGRVIQGVGGGVLPLSFGIVRDEYPAERVTSVIGGLAAVSGAALGVGLAVSGPITDTLGYTALFWFPMIVATLAAIGVLLFVPDSPVRMPGRIRWPAPVLLSAWLVALLLAVSKAPEWGWASTKVLGLIAAAAVLAAIWIRVELNSETPLIDMRMMRLPAVWTGNLVILLLGVSLYAGFAFIPQFAQTDPSHGYGFGASITASGLIMLPQAIGFFFAGMASGGLIARFGTKRLLIGGYIFGGAAYVLLAVAHDERWQLLLATALIGWGMGLVVAIMPGVIIRAVPAEQTGVAAGMNANIRTIGGAFGAAAMSTIVTSSAGADGIPTEAGYSWGFAMIAVAVAVATLACLLIPRDRSSDAPLDPDRDGTPLEYAELAMTPASPARPGGRSARTTPP